MWRLGLFVIIIGWAACVKDEFCIEPGPVLLNINFKTYDSTNTLVDTPMVHVFVYNTDTTYFFADNAQQMSSVNVILDRKKTAQTYVIQQDIMRDTLVIAYESELNFISNGCGYQTFHTITKLSHTNHSIDSVKIKQRQVNSSPQNPHLEIIY